MKYLQLFNNYSLPITWTSLLIGIEGPGKYENLLNCEDIIQYAIEVVNKQESNLVNEIAYAYSDEDELVYKILNELSENENIDRQTELKKWIVVLLNEHIKELPDNPLYGLIHLTEFWEKFNFPEYSPHIVQGQGNKIQPIDYYSKEFYEKSLLEHKKWINNELMKFQVK